VSLFAITTTFLVVNFDLRYAGHHGLTEGRHPNLVKGQGKRSARVSL
jgi:hypothetical protein